MPDNPAEETVEIQWVYTPADFFEEKIVCDYGDYLVEIEGGRVTAGMSAVFFDSHPDLPGSLSRKLNSYFLGAQPILRKVFEVNGGAVSRLWPDGRKDTTLVAQGAVQVQVSTHADLVVMDDKGVVVGDTRRDRIEATKNLAQLSVRHASDPTARRILESFDASIRYPGNELVYLYEIWDALQTKFRGEKKARRTLGISKSDRSRITNLANKEPLSQGRHRGQFAEGLRDASTAELDEARGIARDMVRKYLMHLDEQQQAK